LDIGKRGQNARLTSKLTGWHVDIEAEQVTTLGFEERVAQAVQELASIPGITSEQADILVHHGFVSLDYLLKAEPDDLSEIPGIGDEGPAIISAVREEAARRNAGATTGSSE
jgi:N utilization substance protein A